LALCLFGGDIPDGGMEPLTIVVSFDVGEQVALGSIACWIADLVNKFGFHGSKVALHGGIVPAISLPAHGLDETGFIQGFAIIGGGILAAAIGVMDQARRGALSLDGHGQGSDGEFGAQMITHRPTNNLPGEEIQYDGLIEPPFGGWHVGDVGQPNLIRPRGHEGLFEQIRRDRQVMMAVRGAHPNRRGIRGRMP
jgi:hypothetical protein